MCGHTMELNAQSDIHLVITDGHLGLFLSYLMEARELATTTLSALHKSRPTKVQVGPSVTFFLATVNLKVRPTDYCLI